MPNCMLVLPLPQRRFTAAEYLRLESDSATRSEFHDGVIYAMTGGSLDHNRIVCNLVHQLRLGLEGSACEVFSSDVRLAVQAHQLFTYPDVMVVCGSPALLEGRNDTLTDAKLIIAVLSPSTETRSSDSTEPCRRSKSMSRWLSPRCWSSSTSASQAVPGCSESITPSASRWPFNR